jgi:hypothetical protein
LHMGYCPSVPAGAISGMLYMRWHDRPAEHLEYG